VQVPADLIRGYIHLRGVPDEGLDADWSSTTNIVGIRDYFNTEHVEVDSRDFDQRITRCFELALAAEARFLGTRGGYLVHGSIHGPFEDNERIAHAWVRVRTKSGIDLGWEPITRLVHLQDQWEDAARAREEVAYDNHNAAKMLLVHRHFGPWAKLRYR
jgi:hypothetical protein